MQPPSRDGLVRAMNILMLSTLVTACGTTHPAGWSEVPSAMNHRVLPSLGATVHVLQPPGLARRGSDRVLAIALPMDVIIEPHHMTEAHLPGPTDITGWSAAIDAPLLVNAGLFTPEGEPLGLAKSQGRWLSERRHPSWLGLMVGDGPSRLVDLQYADDQDIAASQNLWQSMMLIDRNGQLRVRHSQRSACRTVLGQDESGQLVLVLTEGATTLWELGAWLRDGPLKLVQAINLDGGHESQLALRTPELRFCLAGEHGVMFSGPAARKLPAVLAIYPGGPKS